MITIHFTNRAWETSNWETRKGEHGTTTKFVPGDTWKAQAKWAHVRDGCVVYLAANGTEQHIPLDTLFSHVFDKRGDAPLGANPAEGDLPARRWGPDPADSRTEAAL